MSSHDDARLALLPLILWRTPPGLELILAQEGVPFETARSAHRLSFGGSRFVLHDGRSVPGKTLRGLLAPGQTAIDIDFLRAGEAVDPLVALVDDQAADHRWTVGGRGLVERVSRRPKAAIRRRLIERLRDRIWALGGVWMRLAPFPYPYRSAFSLRADLDESVPDDYHRFAKARTTLDGCATHFVSTHAYAHHASVVADLRKLDAQSHGHFHHVYSNSSANGKNLERAHRILQGAGIEPVGFAAPHGRWNPGLDDALEDLGYLYSSDFQLGYDDLPFFPWKNGRFSRILQIPIHPVCEGLFVEAGIDDPATIGGYFHQVVADRAAAGELVVVYGHPERRLGRMPGVMAEIARSVADRAFLWRATFTEISRWWRWRGERKWLVLPRADGRCEIQFEEWDSRYPLAVAIERGGFRCAAPIAGPRTVLGLNSLAYERVQTLSDAAPVPIARAPSLKRVLRRALDWETATPIDELPKGTFGLEIKRGLRRWKQARARATA